MTSSGTTAHPGSSSTRVSIQCGTVPAIALLGYVGIENDGTKVQ